MQQLLNSEPELLLAIVNFGQGSKILKYAYERGLVDGAVFVGKGTVKRSLLQFLELTETRKELVLLGGTKTKVRSVLKEMCDDFCLQKPGKGIAVSIPITGLLSSSMNGTQENLKGEKPMYKLIYTIVELGKADDVLEAAKKAGSTGGTVLTARGSGVHEKSSWVFNMEIEPQKEVVLIISKTDRTQAITESIRKDLQIDEPGHGVIFTVDIGEAHGLYSDEK